MTTHTSKGRETWKAHLLVLLLFGLLTVVMTWPMVAHWSTAVLGPPGDNLEYVWKMWWFKHALLERGVSPLFNPDVFYPFGYPLTMGETTVAHTVLGLPVTALFGEVAAYNSMLFVSFVLSGYSVYLLLRELHCRAPAALLGGMAFAFSPYRMSHLGAGHLPLMGTGWIALFFLFLERTLSRPSWKQGMLAGLFFALTALSSWYYAVSVGVFGGLYVLLRGCPWRKVAAGARRMSSGLLAGVIVVGVLVVPMAVPVIQLYQQGEMQYEQSMKYIDRWSASLVDFVYPNAMHPLWGKALTNGYYQNTNEHLLYLGCVPLVLAAVGLWVRRKERVVKVFALLGMIALVLAMGTTLHFGGSPVYVRVSAEMEQRFCGFMDKVAWQYALNKAGYHSLRLDNGIVIPLPMLFVYLFTPLMGSMRVWARFGMMTMFCTALLAGWGADWVLARLQTGAKRKQWLVLGTMAALLLLDFAVLPYAYGYTEVRAQPVDIWLSGQPEGSPVVHFPLEKTWYGWMLYPARVHGQPTVYGYGTFAPQAARQAAEVLDTWPSSRALAALRAWGVRYVLVGEHSYGDEWPAVRAAMDALPGLAEVAVFEDEPRFHADRLLHLVRPSPNVPVTELINGEYQAFLADRVHVYVME